MNIEVRFTKWGGHRHWRYRVEHLGTDRFGWWLGGRTGILMQRGAEEPIRQAHDFVALVPADGSWIANWNEPGDDRVAVYVDVTTPPERTADVVHAVDLDLDVVRLRDGTVEVLDEDEFAEHQIRYGYPPELIAQARATTDDLVARISARTEPFDQVGPDWLARFKSSPS